MKSLKILKRDSGWLLVVGADVDGLPKVGFADLKDLADLPGQLERLFLGADWRTDKPFGDRKVLTQSKLL